MSDAAVNEATAFTFCPKCGTSLADGCCGKCGWSSSAPHVPRKRFGILITALALLILVSVGLNTMLNFGTVVGWLPSDVLLLMDGDGSGRASTELMQRFRQDKLSKRQMSSLVEQRTLDSGLRLQSPFPVGFMQTLQIEHNCRVPGDQVKVSIDDWILNVDGKQISTAFSVPRRPQGFVIVGSEGSPPPNARIIPSRDERLQRIDLPALDAGLHRIEVVGQLRVRQAKASGEELFARPISLTENVEVKGGLQDYVRPRISDRMLKVARNTCAALAFWTGDEDSDGRYTLKLGVASPEVPFVMSVWVRVGSKKEFTRIGTLTVEPMRQYLAMSHELSLAEVPGITEAKRIQVQLRPDLAAALTQKHNECFGGVVEWDNVPMPHRRASYKFDPFTDEVYPPSRVKSSRDDEMGEPAKSSDGRA